MHRPGDPVTCALKHNPDYRGSLALAFRRAGRLLAGEKENAERKPCDHDDGQDNSRPKFKTGHYGSLKSTPVLSRGQRRLNYALEFRAGTVTVPDKALYQLPFAIEHERLRDILIVAEQRIGEFVIGEPEWILDSKLFGKRRDLIAIFGAADVQPDYLQSLLLVLLL